MKIIHVGNCRFFYLRLALAGSLVLAAAALGLTAAKISHSPRQAKSYVYTPKKGFKGSDELSIDVPWASTDSGPETLMTYTFRIRVE